MSVKMKTRGLEWNEMRAAVGRRDMIASSIQFTSNCRSNYPGGTRCLGKRLFYKIYNNVEYPEVVLSSRLNRQC